MNYNRVIMGGHLTRDPEVKGDEGSVVKFGIAINDYKKNVHFFDVTAFNRGSYELARIVAENFKKGDPILIEGRLEHSTWEKDGEKRSHIGIVMDNFQFAGGKKKEEDVPF